MIRVPRRERTRVGRSRPSTPVQTYRPQQVTRYQTTVERASEVPMTLQANPTPERPRSQFPKGKDSLSEIAKALTDPTFVAEKRAEAIAPLKVVESQGEVFDLADMEKKIKLIEGIPGYADDTELAVQLFKLKEQLAIRKAAGGEKLTSKFNTAPNRAKLAELKTKSDKTQKLEAQSNLDANKNSVQTIMGNFIEDRDQNLREAREQASRYAEIDELNREILSSIRFQDYKEELHDHLKGRGVYRAADQKRDSVKIAQYLTKPIKGIVPKKVEKFHADIALDGDIGALAQAAPVITGKLTKLATVSDSKVQSFSKQQVGDLFTSLSKELNGSKIPPQLVPIAVNLFIRAQKKWAPAYI